MKILFDTSVLVAAVVEPHPMHKRALPWLQRAKKKEVEFLVSSHSLAELYAVLTTLSVNPRIGPHVAQRLINKDIEDTARIISLSSADYASVVRQMSDLGLTGGCIYDALIAKAAEKSEADRLLTFNVDDFKKVWPAGAGVISAP
jgi:predicted nucleic acid-binding protein